MSLVWLNHEIQLGVDTPNNIALDILLGVSTPNCTMIIWTKCESLAQQMQLNQGFKCGSNYSLKITFQNHINNFY